MLRLCVPATRRLIVPDFIGEDDALPAAFGWIGSRCPPYRLYGLWSICGSAHPRSVVAPCRPRNYVALGSEF